MRYSFPLAVLPILILLAGCTAPDTRSVLAIPRSGTARILANEVPQTSTATSESVHWKWSLIGERNWNKATASPNGLLELSDTYPLNTITDRHGCNTWTVDVTVTRKGNNADWEAVLHGTNGINQRTNGNETLAADAPLIVVSEKGSNPNLPTVLALARVGKTQIRWKIAQ